jgi:hypothetical protein
MVEDPEKIPLTKKGTMARSKADFKPRYHCFLPHSQDIPSHRRDDLQPPQTDDRN